MITSVGVRTYCTREMGDRAAYCAAWSHGAPGNHVVDVRGMSAVNIHDAQLITGYSTAAARYRCVYEVIHAVSTPPPLPPATYNCVVSTMPRAITASTTLSRSRRSSAGYV